MSQGEEGHKEAEETTEVDAPRVEPVETDVVEVEGDVQEQDAAPEQVEYHLAEFGPFSPPLYTLPAPGTGQSPADATTEGGRDDTTCQFALQSSLQ